MIDENVFCLMDSIVNQNSSIEMLGGMSQTCPYCGEDSPHCMVENEETMEDIV
ncbi:hypothetical protein [Selenomonas ruminantium]|uniref:hypothetical protein n=1 Tax=Selenomonas ruminantium TaxID=971 RepID=UPI0026EC1947|nr:hypothetical protein [Selenomonas ruminantium]